MIQVPIRVAGELVVKVDDLSPQTLELIKGELSFENEERQTAAREQLAGWWALPETVDLWRVEDRRSGDRVLVLPRGFALRLRQILAKLDAQPVFDDQRVAPEADPDYFRPFVLRDYQLDAVMAMMKAQQGGVQMPGGAGKTCVMLGLLPYLKLKTLVVMDKADLVDQWRERAEQFLGLSIDFDDPTSTGKIGMDVWEERDLTICLRQTLWSRIDELDASRWWKNWGVTIFDEYHHISSETLTSVATRSISQYMIGCSATPARTLMKGKIVEAVVGPVIHRTDRRVLRHKGILIKPTVRVVKTKFTADFWPTHTSDGDGTCEKPGCTKTKSHQHRNNYSSVLKALTEDEQRNKLIAEQIVSERGHIHLVPSRQLKLLDRIKRALEEAGWDGPIYFLRGEENAAGDSRAIVHAIKEGGHWEVDKKETKRSGQRVWVQTKEPDGMKEAVILSTVADEALDVPPIDRVHLVFPMRQSAATEQLIGRGERSSEGKQNTIVTDYCDELCDPLMAQYVERTETYRRLDLGYERAPEVEPVRFSSGTFSSFCDRWPIETTHPITGASITVITREHLFQAMKTKNVAQFDQAIGARTAAEAKRCGRYVDLRDDWESVKYGVMRSIIRDQVEAHPELEAELRATIPRPIVEDRPDPEWGVGPDGNGKNLLGRCWMEVRDGVGG